jgi:ABC-type multidrug transport system ATPase subunit
VAIIDHGRVVEAGRLDELLGEPTLRIRVTELPQTTAESLSRFGPVRLDGDWLTIQPLPPERVPDVVALIATAGGRIHEVDVGRGSLEDRFLRLLAHGSAGPS